MTTKERNRLYGILSNDQQRDVLHSTIWALYRERSRLETMILNGRLPAEVLRVAEDAIDANRTVVEVRNGEIIRTKREKPFGEESK